MSSMEKSRSKKVKYVMEQPVIYEPQAYTQNGRYAFHVYSLTGGVSNNLMIKTIRQALAEKDMLYDYLPTDVREKYALCEYNYAIKQIHFPDSFDTLIEARKRLVFENSFCLFLECSTRRNKRSGKVTHFRFENRR